MTTEFMQKILNKAKSLSSKELASFDIKAKTEAELLLELKTKMTNPGGFSFVHNLMREKS